MIEDKKILDVGVYDRGTSDDGSSLFGLDIEVKDKEYLKAFFTDIMASIKEICDV